MKERGAEVTEQSEFVLGEQGLSLGVGVGSKGERLLPILRKIGTTN